MRKTAASVWFALAMAGCTPDKSASLEPAPAAHRAGQYTAVDNVASIYVETTVGEWPGDQTVLRHTTPLFVKLRNDSASAVRIEYRYFELVDGADREYAALPPHAIEEAAKAPVVQGSNALLDPLFVARGYQIHPMYGSMFGEHVPELQTNRYRLGYSIDYHDTYWSYWRDRETLPTRQMRAYAIPQGVLLPGGTVEGYLFFEKVDDDGGPVSFRAQFIDAESGQGIARASIPFSTGG